MTELTHCKVRVARRRGRAMVDCRMAILFDGLKLIDSVIMIDVGGCEIES